VKASAFIGNDPSVRQVLETVEQVADTDATVLITGETGTGKELIARALHEGSARRSREFVAVNCGALADTLLESELFGHLRGAFTGAAENRPGRFEVADRGTIFLDEVADMSHALQAKILRVLQTGEYAPVGSAANRRCDARVIAATNEPLRPLVAAGTVRADLYYRLNVICLDLPPLRARRADIPLLVEHFLSRFSEAYGRGRVRLGQDAERIVLSHPYPGNVRELENAIRRAVILCRGGEIVVRDLPRDMLEPLPSPESAARVGFHAARARALGDFEREFLVTLLQTCGGNVSRAARRSGLSERHLHVKLKKYGLRGRDFMLGDAG
jgi:DNA-binding NtrC family response regulator